VRWSENDGTYFRGYVKPANYKQNRRDRRLSKNRSGKRRVVVVMRERNGRSQSIVAKAEHEAVPQIGKWVRNGATIYADEASHWDALHGRYEALRINHAEAYAHSGACTNMAESFFIRIAGPDLEAYSDEMAWREDNRRRSTGELYTMTASAALKHPVSRQWKGYWQRRAG
jgi:ISXO2-like transposase domain